MAQSGGGIASRNKAVAAPLLSPVLLAGFALKPLPPMLLDPLLDRALARMRRSHPAAFDRLRSLGEMEVEIDPIDLPIVFRLQPGGMRPRFRAHRRGSHLSQPAAALRGSFLMLTALLEGRVDGDAVFFSRGLSIEGDTAAIMTLRYAVDGAAIDILSDLAEAGGPLAAPLHCAVEILRGIYRRADADLNFLVSALCAPIALALRRQGEAIETIERRLAEQGRRLERAEARSQRAAAESQPQR